MKSQIYLSHKYKPKMILSVAAFLFVAFVFEATYANKAKEAKKIKLSKIVVLGDSLTEGYGVAKGDAFPALLQKKMRENGFPELEIINAGIGGSTSASAPGRLKWLLKGKPDLVILALGGNDGLRGFDLKTTEKNLVQTIEYAQSKNVKIILAGMQIPPNYGKKYTKDFKNMFPRIAKKMKVDLIPFLLEGVGGERELNLPDGIHPNEDGHIVITETLFKFLKDRL